MTNAQERVGTTQFCAHTTDGSICARCMRRTVKESFTVAVWPMTDAQATPWKAEREHLVSLDDPCPQCEAGASTDRGLEFMEDIILGDQ